jgi:hypothetical protein
VAIDLELTASNARFKAGSPQKRTSIGTRELGPS